MNATDQTLTTRIPLSIQEQLDEAKLPLWESIKPKGKGAFGVHLCEAYFILAMALACIFGIICDREIFNYDISLMRILLLMAGGTSTVWLITQRARSSRWLGAITALVCATLSIVDHAAFDAYATLSLFISPTGATLIAIAEYAGAVAVALYLLFSPQARRVLCEPPDLTRAKPGTHSYDVPLRKRVRTWEFWRDLLIYFIVFSIVGHWAEILFCRLILAGVFMGGYDPTNTMLWNQWLFPFTAEGAALVAIVVILHPAARKLLKMTGGRIVPAVLLSFLLNALICTGIDFTTGMVSNLDYSLWDYRDMPFNFMGQVCLQNSMIYSIAATLIVWVFYPLMDRAICSAPRGVVNAVAFGLIGMYMFLAALHFITI